MKWILPSESENARSCAREADAASPASGAVKNRPVADFRRMSDVAGQGEFRAREDGLEIVERPRVVFLESQFSLDVVEREGVCRRERQDEFALRSVKPSSSSRRCSRAR